MADARIDGAIAVIAVRLNRRLVWEALQAAALQSISTPGDASRTSNRTPPPVEVAIEERRVA
jgi:hypothetical protein